MDFSRVTSKGQVVIPVKLRRKFGIKEGTRIMFEERGDEIILRPVVREYFEKLAGILGKGGKLLKALKEEKAREREL